MPRVLAGIAATLLSAPAVAQPADVITVSANRRSEPLSQIAESIARVDEGEIVAAGADHVSELLARTPGAYIHRGNGQEHLTAIRSPVLTGGAGAGSFLFLEDGVPLRAKGFANVNGLFEAHSELAHGVEIVRGPGGVVHGSNAVHGVVNILTPSLDGAETARLRASGGSFGRVKADALLRLKGDRQAGLIAFSNLHEGGFRDDTSVDQQKVTLKHRYDTDGLRITTTAAGAVLAQETGGFVRGVDAYRDPVLRRSNPNPEAHRDASALRLATRLDWRAGGVDFSLTPYARWNEMEFRLHFLPSRALEDSGHWSVGAQGAAHVSYDSGAATLGVDLERTRGYLAEVQSRSSFGSFPQGVHYDYEARERNASVFGLIRQQLASGLSADLGLRVESTRYEYDNLTAADDIGRFRRPADRTDSFTTVAAKAGLIYALNETNTVFAAWKRGQRAPQTADLYRLQTNQTPGELDPETLDSFEIGARGEIGPARLEGTVYAMEKRDFFFRDADGFNVSDGETRHIGVEFAADIRLHDSLNLVGNVAYGRHSYRFDRPVGRNATESISSGDEVDTAPRWISNTRLVWTPSPQFRGEVEWARVGAYFTDAANQNDYPGHNIVNLRARYQLTESLTAFAALRNIADTFYAERADFSFGSERYFPGEERSISGGLDITF